MAVLISTKCCIPPSLPVYLIDAYHLMSSEGNGLFACNKDMNAKSCLCFENNTKTVLCFIYLEFKVNSAINWPHETACNGQMVIHATRWLARSPSLGSAAAMCTVLRSCAVHVRGWTDFRARTLRTIPLGYHTEHIL